ncbi:MAG: hypothetical protein QOJ99_5892 [Bryobacterales bacterium]|nr:hypothetical protein [Bryobacterales bacterium]
MKADAGEAGSAICCVGQQAIIDEVRVCVENVYAVSVRVREAVERNDSGELTALTEEVNGTRKQIDKLARRFAVHRAEHGCRTERDSFGSCCGGLLGEG